ncbi:hypothetical protein SAMN06265221_1081, partial [Paracoccus laeviglucosivorans]
MQPALTELGGFAGGFAVQEQAGPADLFILGGGINGCGIARDAVGR